MTERDRIAFEQAGVDFGLPKLTAIVGRSLAELPADPAKALREPHLLDDQGLAALAMLLYEAQALAEIYGRSSAKRDAEQALRAAGAQALFAFDPDQARDEHGMWTSTGGGSSEGQGPEPSRKDVLNGTAEPVKDNSGPAIAKARTGEPLDVTLYRGEIKPGAKVIDRVPSVYAEGQHWTSRKDIASTYTVSAYHRATADEAAGWESRIRTEKVSLKNPYVWDLPKQGAAWDDLKKEFGTEKPEDVTRMLRAKGHDALVVRGVPGQRRLPTGEIMAFPASNEIIVFPKAGAKLAFDPDQARDEDGKWTAGGGTSSEAVQKVDALPEFTEVRAWKDAKSIRGIFTVNEDPPYGEGDLDGFQSKDLPVRSMRADEMVMTQPMVRAGKVKAIIEHPKKEEASWSGGGFKDDKPLVVHKDGKYYVQDGHHRVTAAHMQGKPVDVYVVDLDAEGAKLAEPGAIVPVRAKNAFDVEPKEAVEYFKVLAPGTTLPPGWEARHRRSAFTMAVTADQTMLKRVHEKLLEKLQAGERKDRAWDFKEMLDDLGLTNRNPQYAEMVLRTNVMDSYNDGYDRQMRDDPSIRDEFPYWEYLAIEDDRLSDEHGEHLTGGVNGTAFYPADQTFAEVRGDRVYNCRCSFRWVHVSEAKALGLPVDEGALLAFDPDQARDENGMWTATGSSADAHRVDLDENQRGIVRDNVYAGISDREWAGWAEDSWAIQDAVTGAARPGHHDAMGQVLTAERIARDKAVGLQIQKAAESNAVMGTLYRGESFEDEAEMRAKYRYNKLVSANAPTSTATKRDIAETYAKEWGENMGNPVRATLRFSSGDRILPGVQTAPLGVPSSEVVMPAGAKFRVASIVKQPNGSFLIDLYTKKGHAAKGIPVAIPDPEVVRHVPLA